MSAEHYAKPAASTKNDSRLHLLPPAASKSMENRSLVMFLSQVEHSHSQGLLQRSTVGSKSIWFTYAGFPQVRHYKISRLFQITLKYFEAFRGAFYNRGGAIILRVRGTNITASEASRQILGVVPPHTCMTFWGTTAAKRHTESLPDSKSRTMWHTIKNSITTSQIPWFFQVYKIPWQFQVFQVCRNPGLPAIHTSHMPNSEGCRDFTEEENGRLCGRHQHFWIWRV